MAKDGKRQRKIAISINKLLHYRADEDGAQGLERRGNVRDLLRKTQWDWVITGDSGLSQSEWDLGE